MTDASTFRPGPWRRVVALVRLVLMAAATSLFAVTLALLRAATRGERRRRIRNAWFAAWSRLMFALLGGRTIVHGSPPDAPFFLASNHLGYLDIVALAQVAPASFVSKAEVRDWPVIGWLTRLADTLYIRRERKSDIPRANAAIAAAVARGDSVALFPEGTSSESDFVLPVRPPLLAVAAEHGIPVTPAALYFETRPGDPHAHRAICYYGDMVFARHVWRLLHLQGFTVTIRFAPASVRAPDRKTLAQRVEAAIHALQLHNAPGARTGRVAGLPGVAKGLTE